MVVRRVSMLFLRRPTAEAIRAFLASQARLDLTYSAVGASATTPPAEYVVDRTRIKLGQGEKVFVAANAALERWQQFRLARLEASPGDTLKGRRTGPREGHWPSSPGKTVPTRKADLFLLTKHFRYPNPGR
jgi:hypothetical protein